MEPKGDTVRGETPDVFKTCPGCRTAWLSRSDLLHDRGVRFLGFQPGANEHRSGLFLFNHQNCGTTLALDVSALESLSHCPVLGLSQCSAGQSSKHCLSGSSGEPCPLYCMCGFVEDVVRTIHSWPKVA